MNLSIWNIIMVIVFATLFWIFFANERVQKMFIWLKDQITLVNNYIGTMDIQYIGILSAIIFIMVLIVIISFLK